MSETTEDKAAAKSAATLLVELAQESYEFGVSDTGESYAVPVSGPKVVLPLRGGRTSLRAGLAPDYFNRYRKAAPQQGLADALLVLEGMGQDQDATELYLRVAEHRDTLWLDLGDSSGRAVKIENGAWSVVNETPVKFKRTALMAPLPEPSRTGDLDRLWHWLNVIEDDRPLVLALLVAMFYPSIPHPIASLIAEQGTGKTTTTKALVSVLDPSPVPCRKPPKDVDSWVTAASGSWVVALDNLSTVPDWLSDSLCRAVTGDGDVRRRLYTDGDFAVFAFRRCLIVNGIDLGAVRGDLADRMLPINLEAINPESRLAESELWPRWKADHPIILGGLLDLVAEVAGVAGVLSSVRLESSPRMADFARIISAVDKVRGTDGLKRYESRSEDLAVDLLSGEPFFLAIKAAVVEQFNGSAADLQHLVTPTDPEWKTPRTGWPTNGRAATGALRRLAPTMRKAGWTVAGAGRNGHDKTLQWAIAPPPRRPEMWGERPPQPPQSPHYEPPPPALAGVADVAEQESVPSQDDSATPACVICGGAGPVGFVGDCSRCRAGKMAGTCCSQCGHPRVIPGRSGRCGDCIADTRNAQVGAA